MESSIANRIEARLTEWREKEARGESISLPESADYQTYLKSPLWRKIRRRIMKRDEKLCGCCKGKADSVHHFCYDQEVRDGNRDEDLAAICEGCHNYIHFDASDKRRSLIEANRLFIEGRHDASFPMPKFDLRRVSTDGAKRPDDWPQMSALQKEGWSQELDRQRNVALLVKHEDDPFWVDQCTQTLRERHGMDAAAIAAAVASSAKH